MKYHGKRLLLPILLLLAALAAYFLWPRPDAVAARIQGTFSASAPLDAAFTYLGEPLDTPPALYFMSGRPYVSCDGLFADCEAETQANDGVPVLPLLTAVEAHGLCATFDSAAGRIDLYRAASPSPTAPPAGAAAAYLRLEDIMAAGADDDRMGDAGLERLRVQADTLHAAGQRFYVAWIPVYVDPASDKVNNPLGVPTFYNASFVYTLDYLASRGGILGAHGLTHQYGDERSSVGSEWGKKTPFSAKQLETRLQLCRDLLAALDYAPAFFEFPHYASTPKQEAQCARYFDLIYQQDVTADPFGAVSVRTFGEHAVTYLPTPQDYVANADARADMIARIRDTPPDALVSLFFHPALDFSDIAAQVSADGVRTYTYADSAFLPQLIACLRDTGRTLAAYA